MHCGAFTAKRFGALAALIAQNTALVLVTKFSFSRGVLTPYLVSTVVACSESLKFVVSCALLTRTHGKGAAISAMRDLRSNGARLALPSALYVIQNNLLFKAVQLLSPTMYMVCSQSKILTSALFSVLLLNSRITRRQCLALLTLVAGMILVNASENLGGAERVVASANGGDTSRGLLAVFTATFISGFAGAYLEKMYKSSNHGGAESHSDSVWFRNTQLACFSVPVALMSAYWRDSAQIWHGLFQGYDYVVAIVVILQATGGLVVALVMRHAGNILKCFAVSISMCNCAVFTCLVSSEQTSVSTLVMGLALVVAATFAYSA